MLHDLQLWMNDLAIMCNQRLTNNFVLHIHIRLTRLDHILQEFGDVISKHKACVVSGIGGKIRWAKDRNA